MYDVMKSIFFLPSATFQKMKGATSGNLEMGSKAKWDSLLFFLGIQYDPLTDLEWFLGKRTHTECIWVVWNVPKGGHFCSASHL